MRKVFLIAVSAVVAFAAAPPKPLTPTDIVAAAPPAAWKAINPDNLLVIDLKSGGRVIIQLAPVFAPVHVANMRRWRGPAIGAMPPSIASRTIMSRNGAITKATSRGRPRSIPSRRPNIPARSADLRSPRSASRDPYAPAAGFADGWPIAYP